MNFLEIYRKSIQLMESGTPFVMATLVRAVGSTPQKTGAHAIFEPNGTVHGTLGGGCLEAEARRRAFCAMDAGKCTIFHLKLDEISGWDDGLICGGQATILIQPSEALFLAPFKDLMEAEKRQVGGVLLTHISRDEGILCRTEWLSEDKFKLFEMTESMDDLASLFRLGKVGLLGAPNIADAPLVFVEPRVSAPELLIAGAGHIGKAVSKLAAWLHFRVVVIDDRPGLVSLDLLPGADEVRCDHIPKVISEWPIGEQTYVLIVTRGHRHDAESLAACVQKPAAFIGMIGSRRKSLIIRKNLLEKGLATEQELERVVCPVGVDVGSVSVEEIALSIVAQMVTHRRKGVLDAHAMNFSK
ncbi:MAG: XdhC family protein [Verrucomicrobiota bacterium]|nr:XdhC family protein [Verrucomicrobiota bacterium]